MEDTAERGGTAIQHLVEGQNVLIPDYSGRSFTEEEIAEGKHRNFVSGAGGQWEEGGLGQLAFLKKHGLSPDHKFIDIGCGALRAGRHLIDFLAPGNYYGVDANLSLLQTGYDHELTDEQREKLPVTNLRANDRFDVDLGVTYDMAIAQSVFTHVSLNHMQLCLHRLAKVMKPGGVFYASFVEQPEGTAVDHIFQTWSGGRTYFYEKNVYWYRRSDMRWASTDGPWKYRFVGEYGSAQKQLMVAYTRITDAEFEARKAYEAKRDADTRAVRAAVSKGGVGGFVARARRKAAHIISPN
jgi:SAM-dependent methyltransferase